MKNPHLLTAIACAIFTASLFAQDATRFEAQIDRLLGQEHAHDPDKPLVVFTGSSSIVRWQSVGSDFPDYNVLNYGFGGSHFSDLAYYYDPLIRTPAPDMLFIYEGDNDIATGKEPAAVFEQAKRLLEKIRADLPQTQVVLISPKPCIANWGKRAGYLDLNSRLKGYCEDHDNLDFLDVWSLMVDDDGVVFQDLFIADGDHMNAKGYKIWVDAVNAYLDEQHPANEVRDSKETE